MNNATIGKIEVERFVLKSGKPFGATAAALEATVGHPDILSLAKAFRDAPSFAALESEIRRGLGESGFMLFMKLDHGAVLRKESGGNSPNMIRFIVGNPLIMKEMAKRVPDAGSYAPVTILLDERADGVYLSYDRMAGFLAPYGNPEALAVARDLDSKIEALLRAAAA